MFSRIVALFTTATVVACVVALLPSTAAGQEAAARVPRI